MAIWQCPFFILPGTLLSQKADLSLLKKDEDGCFEDDVIWKEANIHEGFFKEVETILPKSKSWSKNLVIYGDLESTDLQVYIKHEIILSVSLRVDFSNSYETALRQLIEFFIIKGLIVLDQDLNILPLNFESLQATIQNCTHLKTYNKLLNR